MHEILDHLPAGARVLDLGSREGSFPAEEYRGLLTVRVDVGRPAVRGGCFVQADAAGLPFRARAFDAVVLNHSLEHFVEWKRALQEIGRVVKREGAVYVAVPDGSSFADRLYRRVYLHAGGHVNLFDSPGDLARTLAWYFSLPHLGTRTLGCGFNFLNRRNTSHLRREMLFRGLPERPLALLTGALRWADRHWGTRLSVYGWAFYFGWAGEPVELTTKSNVCVRCGRADPADWLVLTGRVRKKWSWLAYYHCPGCGAANVYLPD